MPAGNEITSAERRSVKLLPKYLCRICEKWKEPASYSKKELNTYTWRAGNGHSINGVSAKLRCRGCAGGSLQEMLCEGHCAKWKDLQQFSKQSRRGQGASRHCLICSSWVEAVEPGITVHAPPEGELAPDEDYTNQDDDDYGTGALSDPEAGGSDYDDDFSYNSRPRRSGNSKTSTLPGSQVSGHAGYIGAPSTQIGGREWIPVPYASMASLSVSGADNNAIPTHTSQSGYEPNNGPPHSQHNTATGFANGPVPVRVNNWGTPVSSSVNGQTTAYANGGSPDQDHASNNFQHGTARNGDMRSESPVSNPYEDRTSDFVEEPVWEAVDARRRAPPPVRNFTGYDNHGQEHPQQRIPSSGSERSGTVYGSALTPQFYGSSTPVPPRGPAPAPMRTRPQQVAPIAPAPAPMRTRPAQPAPVANANNSKWAKPVGSRNVQRYTPAPPRQVPTPPGARRPDVDNTDFIDM